MSTWRTLNVTGRVSMPCSLQALGCSSVFILASVYQRLALLVIFTHLNDFPDTRVCAHVVSLFATLCTTLCFALPVLHGYWTYGGYTTESQNQAMTRSFITIACLTALGRTMQACSANKTHVLLQLSCEHLIVPLVMGTLLTYVRYDYSQILSRSAIVGCFMIILGSLGHFSVSFLSCSGIHTVDIFWRSIYLLSIFPFALSAVLQQHFYAIRRINVVYFFFRVMLYQLMFQTLFTPFATLQGVRLLFWLQLGDSMSSTSRCVVGLDAPHCIEPQRTKQVALLYIVFTVLAQWMQIFLVRKVTHKFAAFSVLLIPTMTLCILLLLKTPVAVVFLSSLFTPFEVKQLQDSNNLNSAMPKTITILDLLVIFGSAFCRLHPSMHFERDYALEEDPLFFSNQHFFQLFAPFLRQSSDAFDNQTQRTSPRGFPRSMSHRRFNPSAADSFYLPSPLPTWRRLPRIVRPTLMNPWSGVLLSEYTDYKRWNDCALSRRYRENASGLPFVRSHDEGTVFERAGGGVVFQYTKAHMRSLRQTEETLQEVYAFRRLGFLAASLLTTNDDNVEPFCKLYPKSSFSSHSDCFPGQVAEEGESGETESDDYHSDDTP